MHETLFFFEVIPAHSAAAPMSSVPAERDRLQRVLTAIAQRRAATDASDAEVLCMATIDILDVGGAGISVHGPSGAIYSVGVAGPDMARLHELERTLGEGPCIDAFNHRNPTAEPDLAEVSKLRWPAFCAEALLRTSARAAFGYPLRMGDECFGALNLYNTRAGPLTADQHEDALLLADLSTRNILTNPDPEQTQEAPALEILGAIHIQVEVHQATGMVSAQLSVPVADALALLRARAFAEGRTIGEVAADVVARRTRFEA